MDEEVDQLEPDDEATGVVDDLEESYQKNLQ
jgi:hypothetical protein